MFSAIPAFAQEKFNCEGQVYAVDHQSSNLYSLSVNASNNSVRIEPLFDLGVFLDPLGFRPSDQLIYGLDPVNFDLYQIDALGSIVRLKTFNFPGNYQFLAGAISNNSRYMYVVGSSNQSDQNLIRIDLDNYEWIELIRFGGQSFITDLAFDPYTNELYGADSNANGIAKIDLSTGSVTVVNVLKAEDKLEGLYFDAFGTLLGYGNTAYGVASALFELNKSDLEYRRISTGPVANIGDLASCPFTVAMHNSVNPLSTLPCGELDYTFSIANPSAKSYSGIDFYCALPPGVTFNEFTNPPANGQIINGSGDSYIQIDNLQVLSGVSNFTASVYVDDVPEDFYRSQASLIGFPDEVGTIKLSDDPVSATFLDSTKFKVTRIDFSELAFSQLLCLGESTILDASEFGGNISWIGGGGTGSYLEVNEPGTYGFIADSGCQDLEVTYEVIGASCPYVIELGHTTEPSETFPCSEVIYRYILENDSGVDRDNIRLVDSLQEGFQFMDLVTELKSGELTSAFPSDNFIIEDITMELGKDTIDFLVYVGDINPDEYFNRSEISGFHPELGILRVSDDPRTLFIDSTMLSVKGTRSDSTYLRLQICDNESIELNGAEYGQDLLWDNGSKDSVYTITKPGIYELQVFDGCENAFVFFEIEPALKIEIHIPESSVEVHLGDSILLTPQIYNEGNIEDFYWFDPVDTTLHCLTCLSTFARPFDDISYIFHAENEMCRDSLEVRVKVDKTRRIYIPNIFTPNGDTFNDRLYVQSPDYGRILELVVYDQWGSVKFRSETLKLNDPENGWRPYENGFVLPSGVYTYILEIEFIDKEIEIFTGTITLIN